MGPGTTASRPAISTLLLVRNKVWLLKSGLGPVALSGPEPTSRDIGLEGEDPQLEHLQGVLRIGK